MNKYSLLSGFFLLSAFSGYSSENTRVKTYQEVSDPTPLTVQQQAAWDHVSKGLNAMWGDIDMRHSRSIVPDSKAKGTNSLSAWRGERCAAELLLWTAEDVDGVSCEVAEFKAENGNSLPGTIATPYFVRYTIGGAPLSQENGEKILVPDMLDTIPTFDIAARTVRPVWISVDVPRDAAPGEYVSEVKVKTDSGTDLTLPLKLRVQEYELPPATDWQYHLDLWQHPTAVARTAGVKVWSDEHFEALRPIMTRLRDAGQKVITATLNKDPWNHQCYDGYENMIVWTKHKDGSWSYDYTAFDRWVELMLEIGIKDMINCYSMAPWNCELEYIDEATGKVVTVNATPGTEIFTEMWKPFLVDFTEHLRKNGWLEITNMAMDERAPEQMDAAVALLQECAPEMGFAIADMHKSYKRYNMMRDVCVAQQQPADLEDILDRRKKGLNTTFYVCCNPNYPNTFSASQPYEAELLGWYGLALDYDGMLRWAYNSWTEDPINDSRFGNWISGDTYLVYPGNRSTIRFERLRDGIEAAEKVRALRKLGVDTSATEEILNQIRSLDINDSTLPWRQIMQSAQKTL